MTIPKTPATPQAADTASNPLAAYQNGIDLTLQAAKLVLGAANTGNLPIEIIDAAQALVDQLMAHWNDTVTKADLEANRG